jgi:hypothetical protein
MSDELKVVARGVGNRQDYKTSFPVVVQSLRGAAVCLCCEYLGSRIPELAERYFRLHVRCYRATG